jgi:hypothetical protein
VAQALAGNAWTKDITGALTLPVLMQYLQVWQALQNVHLNHLVKDGFRWRWNASGRYSASSAYRALFLGQEAILGAREPWKTRAPNKCRFFLWLVLHDRCWTSERLRCHDLKDDDLCARRC